MPGIAKIAAVPLLLFVFPLAGQLQSAPGTAAQSSPAAAPRPAQAPQSMPPSPPVTAPPNGELTPVAPPLDPCADLADQPAFDACEVAEFKAVDQEVNRLYRAALLIFEKDIDDAHKSSDNDQLAFDSTAIADLKAAQAAWTKYRDLHCSAAAQQFQGGSIQPEAVNRCMILVTQHRIEEIREAYEIGGRKLE